MKISYSNNNNLKTKTAELVISKTGKKTLSKNQVEFNKLTSKIEKLQKEIVKKQDRFDLALKLFRDNLYPLKNTLQTLSRENLILLWEHYKTNKLSKKDTKYLKGILKEQLQSFIEELATEPDEKIKEIFMDLEGVDYRKILEQEEEEMKKFMQETLKKAKVNLSDIDINDEDALRNKIFELHASLSQEENFIKENVKNKIKSKSSKQVDAEKIQETAEELKKKNISTIYKQLAKLFHPDLEQDEERKAEKMLLMQELTAAYEAKNLHALLTLELKWIHKENNHLESLTEEKLHVYLQILKEQIQSLTEQKREVINQPQYNVLVDEFGFEIIQYPIETINEVVIDTKIIIKELKSDNKLFKTDNALTHVKNYIKRWKAVSNEFEEDELFTLLFGK